MCVAVDERIQANPRDRAHELQNSETLAVPAAPEVRRHWTGQRLVWTGAAHLWVERLAAAATVESGQDGLASMHVPEQADLATDPLRFCALGRADDDEAARPGKGGADSVRQISPRDEFVAIPKDGPQSARALAKSARRRCNAPRKPIGLELPLEPTGELCVLMAIAEESAVTERR
jgi:hypothetical protein